MRPVKKFLKALDDPEEKKNELRYVNHMQECLLEIGSHISKCLEEYKDPDKIREWRRFILFILYIIYFFIHNNFILFNFNSNLWFFVSKFTEFDSKKLLKIYRKGLHTTEKLEKDNNVKDKNKIKEKSKLKLKEDKKHQKNVSFN